MRSVHRSLSILAISTAVVGGLVTGVSTAAAAPPSGPGNPGKTGTVTLITGDQVTVHPNPGGGKPLAVVKPAPGREKVPYTQGWEKDKLVVLPFDAMGFIVDGKLDKQLFNVTDLLAEQEGRAGKSPLLVKYASANAAQQRTADLRIDGAQVRRVLPAINTVAASVPDADATRFWKGIHPTTPAQAREFADSIQKLSRDGVAKPHDADSVKQVGAPAAWQRGQTAKGVKVAILDTGIDANHPDLAGRIKETKDFTEAGIPDDVGHGTHVAGIIAGSGPEPGVAPDADLYIGRVCESWGCPESSIIAGMEWAALLGAKVINMSLGGGPTDGTDEMSQAVNQLSAKYGVLFVVSAGNGYLFETVGSPGSADAALTVGSATRDGQVSYFSSRGPRVGDNAIKPEVTGPGYAIAAARAAGTSMGYPLNDRHTLASGTSMSAPHVTGAAAILAGQHPDWTPAQLKAALVSSADPLKNEPVFDQGVGLVNVDRATSGKVFAETATLNLSSTKTGAITYRNTGDQPVRLDLQLPAGITADTKQVTVPAKGTAAVNVTATAANKGVIVTARSGNEVVRTAVSTGRLFTKHKLKISTIDRHGNPNGQVPSGGIYAFPVVFAAHDLKLYASGGLGGQPGEADFPAGRYTVFASIPSPIEGCPSWEPSFTMVAKEVILDKDSEVVLDARGGIETSATVNGAQPGERSLGDGFGMVGEGNWAFPSYWGAYVVPSKTPGMVYLSHEQIWDVPGSTKCGPGGGACNFGAVSVDKIEPARFAVTDADLATVHADIGAPFGPRTVERLEFLTSRFGLGAPPGADHDTGTLPGKITSHYYSRGPATWDSIIVDFSGDPSTYVQGQPNAEYTSGKVYQEQWVKGLLSPRAGSSNRTGNFIEVDPRLTSDFLPNRSGYQFGPGTSELYRNGKLVDADANVAPTGYYQVPPGRDRYQVNYTGDSGTTAYSKVAVTWEFQSQATKEKTALPLSTVRFVAPITEAQNLMVPFYVERSATSGRTREVTVDVSFDDGKTWAAAKVVLVGDAGVAKIQRPTTGSLSLRATAEDSDGNTVRQESIHLTDLT